MRCLIVRTLQAPSRLLHSWPWGTRLDNPAGSSASGISRRTARCSAVSRGHPGHVLQRVTLRHLVAHAGIRSVPFSNPVRTLALPVGVEIRWRPAVGIAVQPFERKSASDRGLSSISSSARLLAQRLLREFKSQADDASCRWGVLGRGCSHWRSDICRVSHP